MARDLASATTEVDRREAGRLPAPSDPSWWQADAFREVESDRPDAPAIASMPEVDVLIVGGGFTGLWTAISVKERSPSTTVAIVEASLCGSGASGKNGGKVHGY